MAQKTQAMTPSRTGREMTNFQLPKPVDAGTPIHTVKGEALLNSLIVLRGVGAKITSGLGPCRPVFFQFPADYEDKGPVKGGAIKDDNGEWIAHFPDDDDAGVYQFLLSETSPALKVAKSLMGEHMESRGTAARVGVMRSQRSAANVGQAYYVFDRPQDGDLYADRNQAVAASMP